MSFTQSVTYCVSLSAKDNTKVLISENFIKLTAGTDSGKMPRNAPVSITL